MARRLVVARLDLQKFDSARYGCCHSGMLIRMLVASRTWTDVWLFTKHYDPNLGLIASSQCFSLTLAIFYSPTLYERS